MGNGGGDCLSNVSGVDAYAHIATATGGALLVCVCVCVLHELGMGFRTQDASVSHAGFTSKLSEEKLARQRLSELKNGCALPHGKMHLPFDVLAG